MGIAQLVKNLAHPGQPVLPQVGGATAFQVCPLFKAAKRLIRCPTQNGRSSSRRRNAAAWVKNPS